MFRITGDWPRTTQDAILPPVRDIQTIYNADAEQEEWWAPDSDSDGEGGVAMAVFAGPLAEQRAKTVCRTAEIEYRSGG
jgi:hypothetical protein